jgi:ribosomal protein L20
VLSYSRLTNGLSPSEIEVDRKVLSDIPINYPVVFAALAAAAQVALAS